MTQVSSFANHGSFLRFLKYFDPFFLGSYTFVILGVLMGLLVIAVIVLVASLYR